MTWPHNFHDWHAWLLIACYPCAWYWGWSVGSGRFLPRPKGPR